VQKGAVCIRQQSRATANSIDLRLHLLLAPGDAALFVDVSWGGAHVAPAPLPLPATRPPLRLPPLLPSSCPRATLPPGPPPCHSHPNAILNISPYHATPTPFPPLQGRVPLDVLAVLVQRRGTDALQIRFVEANEIEGTVSEPSRATRAPRKAAQPCAQQGQTRGCLHRLRGSEEPPGRATSWSYRL
jgi:hypothetical protein